MTQSSWTTIDPPFGRSRKGPDVVRRYARKLRSIRKQSKEPGDFDDLRQEMLNEEHDLTPRVWPVVKAACLLIADLVEQQWEIRIRNGLVQVRQQQNGQLSAGKQKALVRHQELVKRNAQLCRESVRTFVSSMERVRVFDGEFVSIFSLMRDGREMANRIAEINSRLTNGNADALFGLIDPYIEFVDDSKRCSFTGLRLMDIWRYFRHTWTNQYTSVPGRSMLILIRDASTPRHCVVGIASLCSPIVQLRERDRWIGWHPDAVLEDLETAPTTEKARWLIEVVDRSIKELYTADFLKDGLLSRYTMAKPNMTTIDALRRESKYQRRAHHRYTNRSDYQDDMKGRTQTAAYWKTRAKTHLFRSKRAEALATYLEARMHLNSWLSPTPTAHNLAKFLTTSDGKRTVRKVARKAKADKVGVAMADINVCGAIAPYNAILGGKLVSMLVTSPEVVKHYRQRYGQAESVIASSMAGRAISRPANLVFLGTTSLYGANSSQYNRLHIPADTLDAKSGQGIRYHRLGRSESFGTSHYSDVTVQALVDLVQHASGGQRVNSIFGEGSSPKLRKVREGLEILAPTVDALLRHGRQRLIFGVPLTTNTKEYLLGRHKRPRYISPNGRESTRKIVAWWMSRWLRHRILRPDVLKQVASHTLIKPVHHGARVVLPGKQNPATSSLNQPRSRNAEPASQTVRD